MTTLFNPKESLLTIAGAQFNPTFVAADLIGSDDSILADGFGSDINGGKEAMCRVTMNKVGYAGAAYTGGAVYQRKDSDASSLFFYNKVDLSEIANVAGSMFKLYFIGHKPTMVSTILNTFKGTFGIALTPNDVYDYSIIWSGDAASVLLEAKPNSLTFKGSVTLALEMIAATEVQRPQLNGNIAFTGFTTTVTGKVMVGDNLYVLPTNYYNPVNNSSGSNPTHPSQATATAGFVMITYTYYDGYMYQFDIRGRLIRQSFTDWSWEILPTSPYHSAFGLDLSLMEMVGISGKIYVYGGRYTDGNTTQYPEAFAIYDIESATWTTVETNQGVYGHSMAVYNGRIYVIGGRGPGSTPYSYIRYFDPSNGSWNTTSHQYIGEDIGFINVGNRLYVIMGRATNGGQLPNIYVLDPIADTFIALTTVPVAHRRVGCGYGYIGDTIYVTGGINPSTGTGITGVTAIT